MNITTNFPNLKSINDIASSNDGLLDLIQIAENAYNNSFYYSYSSFDTSTSTQVSGHLSNGDYAVAYGRNLGAYPSTITQGDYYFIKSGIKVSLYGLVTESGVSPYPTGYINKAIVSNNKSTATINCYFDLSDATGTISSLIIQNGQDSISVIGNLTGNQSSISGTLSSIDLSSGSNSIKIDGSIDIKSSSNYSNFTDFLAATMSGNDTITGTNGSEYLFGFGGNDNLSAGYYGDDTLDGGTGNDILDGGTGLNTAVYSGNKSSYTVSKNGDAYSINSTIDGSDTLNNIQYLQFTDGVIAIDSALPKPITTPVSVVVNSPVIEIPKSVISTKPTTGNDLLTGTVGNDTINGLTGSVALLLMK